MSQDISSTPNPPGFGVSCFPPRGGAGPAWLAGGHGVFSAGVAFMLVLWAAAALAAARGLWARRVWSRGPATMIALVHAFGFGEFAVNDQPLPWLAFVVAAATLVALVLPVTARSLGLGTPA